MPAARPWLMSGTAAGGTGRAGLAAGMRPAGFGFFIGAAGGAGAGGSAGLRLRKGRTSRMAACHSALS
jgi:hypothetical protein